MPSQTPTTNTILLTETSGFTDSSNNNAPNNNTSNVLRVTNASDRSEVALHPLPSG
jgi:hypothetical protein